MITDISIHSRSSHEKVARFTKPAVHEKEKPRQRDASAT